MLHGNLEAAHARELAASLQALLGPGCSVEAGQRVRDTCVRLEPHTALLHCQPTKNPEETNAAVEIYYQVGRRLGLRLRRVVLGARVGVHVQRRRVVRQKELPRRCSMCASSWLVGMW
jgi:hypothetical protein